MEAVRHRRSLLLLTFLFALLQAGYGCDDRNSSSSSSSSSTKKVVSLTASQTPATFVLHTHSSEDLSIRTPPDWRYFDQPFKRQNDVLVGLFPAGSVPASGGGARVYLHGHALPDGITFDQYVRGHENGTFAQNEGQTFLSSEPATLNGLPAHRWTSAGGKPGGTQTRRLMVATLKARTVYYAEFRAPPDRYDALAPLAEQAIASLTIGTPTAWPTAPPPPQPGPR
jgi:hypothetical protein